MKLELEDAFRHWRLNEEFADLDYVREKLNTSKETVLAEFEADDYYQFIDDPIKEMEWWACFREQNDESDDHDIDMLDLDAIRERIESMRAANNLIPFVRSQPKIGRNDSCPCNSGKKYKKCCMNKTSIYTFQVRHKNYRGFHSTIELLSSKNLHDLHNSIQRAFKWDNDHLYSFFLDNKFHRSTAEYSGDLYGKGNADILLKNLPLKEGMTFGYLFDYGDNHEFEVKVISMREAPQDLEHQGSHSIQTFGEPPEQYGYGTEM